MAAQNRMYVDGSVRRREEAVSAAAVGQLVAQVRAAASNLRGQLQALNQMRHTQVCSSADIEAARAILFRAHGL